MASNRNKFELRFCPDKKTKAKWKTEIFYQTDSLRSVKRHLLESLDPNIPIDGATLIWFDDDLKKWTQFSDEDLNKKIKDTSMENNSFVSIEIHRNPMDDISRLNKSLKPTQPFTLQLCVIPLKIRKITPLIVNPKLTVKELKAIIYGKFKQLPKDRPVFILKNSSWKIYHSDLDEISLEQCKVNDGDIISIENIYSTYDLWEPPGLCGLQNLGNTCFMNSALQCLSHTPAFATAILDYGDGINSPILAEYIKLMKNMWSGVDNRIRPSSFFYNIAETIPQYGSYHQQDVQEFMNHFLHLIHDELTGGHSIVDELFYGKIQSHVTCQKCRYECKTISPISFIPLAINHEETHKICLIKCDGEQIFHSIMKDIKIQTVGDLIDLFFSGVDINVKRQVVKGVQLVNNSIQHIYNDSDFLSYTMEELALIENPELSSDEKTIMCEFWNKSNYERFRPSVIFKCSSVNPNLIDIEEQLQNTIGHVCSVADVPSSSIKVFWFDGSNQPYEIDMERQSHMKLYYIKRIRLECDSTCVEKYNAHMKHSSSTDDISLINLLHSFFEENTLEDDYSCVKCNNKRTAKQKTQLLAPLPSVLIIQLKRFRVSDSRRFKHEQFIDFPLENLDLKDFVVRETTEATNSNGSTTYDLVAVSNHRGTLNAGHYTAYAKYEVDDQWYLFDDEFVDKLTEKTSVVTKNAYLLVYVQRK